MVLQTQSASRKVFQKQDIKTITVLLGVAAAVFLVNTIFSSGKSGTVCEIVVNGIVIERLSLTEDKTLSLDGYPNMVFQIKNGSVAFTASDCPDKICVHTGFIKHIGQVAVCLPNNTLIRIKSAGENQQTDEPDVTAY